MWTVLGSDPSVSRRTVLKVGALGALGLPDLLRARAQTAEPRKPRSALMIFLAGGPSHFETFDPKPDAPGEIRGPFNPIATRLSGVTFSETMPQVAEIADRVSIVRSCHHDNPGHGGGQRYVETGYKSASLEGELPHDYPAVGSIVSKVRGPMHAGMPTYVHLPNGDDGGAQFLGNAYDAFQVYSNGKPVGLKVVPSIKLSRLEDRRGLRQQFDRLARDGEARRTMDSMDALEQQSLELLSSTAVHDAFDMNKEPQSVRDRYGKHEAGKCFLLARRFLEAGAGIVTVRFGNWDHHGNAGGTVSSGAKDNCPPLDQALSALVLDLESRGMLDDVVLWCWGEFGRTPRINSFSGRDHWPQAMSVLLAGGGIRPGQVIGATSAKGEYPIDAACSPADVLATVYYQLGINPQQQFLNTAGRPISILGHGERIPALL